MSPKPTPSDATEGALLALESQMMRHAFSFDPMLAMSVSKVDSLPHQIEAVYDHVLKKPRIRFMLAHDPGAGKTIMAGLILKDMNMRGMIGRVLVVVPGQLRGQWQWELKHRFGEEFEIVDRDTFSQKGSVGTWDGNRIITSIDFAKRDDVLKSIKDAHFDLVIVDEAHKMSAYTYGRTTSKTKRYHLGEALSMSSKHMVFLTATPHKGDAQNFRLLLDLLEPGFFSVDGMIQESVKDGNNPVFLRRAKEDMVGFDGTPLFVPRTVYTPDVKMTDAEKTLYSEMSQYVTEQYNLATRSVKSHNITFALIILQRRFASSIYALVKSLRRRLGKLEQLEGAAEEVTPQEMTQEYAEKVDEMSEKERWEEEQKWELISAAQNIEELRAEIETLAGLLEQAQKVIGTEAKLFQLKETLEELDRTYPDEKVLVFTESKDTLDYLVQHIRTWGYEVNTIHGAMGGQERKDAEVVFRDQTRVMVATEAAGEGINLQFCRLMVNYDLPWNPNRLEQRMGRIHRYGQKLPVYIFNMVAADTREGEILVRLFEKLEDIRAVMGNDKVFDVISDIVPGKSLSQLLLDATIRAKRQKQIISELDEIMGDTGSIKRQMHDNFTSKRIDAARLKTMQESVNERKLVPEYARSIFCDIITAAGGSVQDGDDYEGRTVRVKVPSGIIKGAKWQRQIYAVFDAESHEQIPDTEFVTFGHPVFDAALKWAYEKFGSLASGTGIIEATDHTGRLDGYITLYTIDITYGTGEHIASHMVACIVNPKTGKARGILPSAILDLDWGMKDTKSSSPPRKVQAEAISKIQEASSAEALKEVESRAEEVREQGHVQAAMSQKYGLRSLDALLDIIEVDIMKLLDKKRRGTKTDIAIRNKRKEREKYRTARRNLERRIKDVVDVGVGKARLVGIARIVPGPPSNTARKAYALDAAMRFEKGQERTSKKISGQGYGFDIRSTDPKSGRVRHILAVREYGGRVEFTSNEWLKAKTMRDSYYLYLVREGRNNVLQLPDPAHTLRPIRQGSMYVVQTDQIESIATEQDQ